MPGGVVDPGTEFVVVESGRGVPVGLRCAGCDAVAAWGEAFEHAPGCRQAGVQMPAVTGASGGKRYAGAD